MKRHVPDLVHAAFYVLTQIYCCVMTSTTPRVVRRTVGITGRAMNDSNYGNQFNRN